MDFTINTLGKLTHSTESKTKLSSFLQGVQVVCRWFCTMLVFVFGSMATVLAAPNQASSGFQTMTLRIELSPAQCLLNPKRSRLRQCREGFAMTVAGLRPEPYVRGKPCSRSGAQLPPLQAKVISRIMPDKVVRDLAWRHYGSCMGMSSPNYFRVIARLAGQLKVPQELSSGNNYVVSRPLFEQQLQRKNSGLNGSHIQMLCQNAPDAKSQVLTELQVCYDSAGKFSSCAHKVSVSCPSTFVIRGLP